MSTKRLSMGGNTLVGSSPGSVRLRRLCVLALVAVAAAACGSTTSGTSPSSSGSSSANVFNPTNFNESSVPWLTANRNGKGSPVQGGTLTLAGSIDFSQAGDPQAEYETIGFEATELFARRLMYYKPSSDLTQADTVVPDVASSPPTVSADGLTYTYHLRSGVMWNTTPPRAVTSQDFLRGLKRECDPTVAPQANPGYYQSTIAGYSAFCTPFLGMSGSSTAAQRAAYINGHDISGITTPDSSTIVFKLTQPATDFNNILAMPFASAAPVENLSFVPLTPGNPIFSDGPYAVSGCTATSTAPNYNDCTGYDVGHSMAFDRNSAWQQSADPIRHQYVDHINIKMDLGGAAAESEVQQEIVAGTTDLSWNTVVPTANLASLQNHSDSRFGAFPAPGTTNPYLVFNVWSGNNGGALKNVKVRQALEYAINKVAMGKIYGGASFNDPLNQVIGPGAQGYVQFNPYPTTNNQGDAAKCKSLLSAAGYPNGLTLTDYYRDNGKHPAVFQEVKSDLGNCGVTVNGTPIATGYYGSKGIGVAASTAAAGQQILAQGKWDLTEPGWIPDWFGANNGRATLPDILDGAISFPGSDWGGYDNPAVDDLVNQAEAAPTLAKADQLWHEADVKVMADAPFVPFQTQLTTIMRSSRVHNAIWMPFSQSYDLTQIWLS